MWDIPEKHRGINLSAWLAGTFGAGLLGFGLLGRGLQKLAWGRGDDQIAAEEETACAEPR
jgi:hypothetical protein